jgi:hypothetical protein
VPALLAMALAFVAMAIVTRLWRADLGAPFVLSGDEPLMQMLVKGVLEHGWYETNQNLGAPVGQQLYDYPVLNGDDLNVILFHLLGLGTRNSAVVLNLFYLLTYPLVALTAFLVLRALSVSRAVAVTCAALYALLPYHFLRGEAHLLLSAYYAVPLGAYLVLSLLGSRPLFARRFGGTGIRAFASRRTLLTFGACVVVAAASGSFYYAAFTLVLAVPAALAAAVVRRERGPLVEGAIVLAVITGVCLLELSPSLVYRVSHGTNEEAGTRSAFESEGYSLRLAQLVLPIEGHRIGALADLRTRYERHLDRTEAVMTTLGVVATLGFAILLGAGLLSMAGGGMRAPPALFGHAAFATFAAFLIGTTGGLSTLIGAVYPQFRAWNRLSIFIAFFALLAIALLLDRVRRFLRAGILFAGALAAVFFLGVLDQTSDAFVPRYGSVAAEYHSDGDFVREVERRLPRASSVFQLPYMGFPEPPYRPGMDLYDLARGYQHSKHLRWSYGAMKGRLDDRWKAYADKPLQEVLPAVAAAGFRGITIDRFGYGGPAGAASLEQELSQLTHATPLVSPNGRLSFFDLGSYQPAAG